MFKRKQLHITVTQMQRIMVTTMFGIQHSCSTDPPLRNNRHRAFGVSATCGVWNSL